MAKVAVVVGVGPGLGSSVAERFAREGFAVALVSRSRGKLEPVAEAIDEAGGTALPVPGDATDPEQVAAIFDTVRDELGDPQVLVYNAGAFQMGGILDLGVEDFEHCWKANCFGGFLCARQVLEAMADAGEGTVIFTGATASLRGSAQFANLAVGKFGLRALAQSTAREFGPRGVHVVHVIIDGQIDLPSTRARFPERENHTFLDPGAIADNYWHLHTQDPTTWTLELDLRPAVESF